MAYKSITNIDSPNLTPAAKVAAVFGTPRRLESITIHHWGNPGQRFDDVVRFLSTKDNGRESSAHYVAEAGRVACLVAPADAAWHAGNAYGNATSIGIECRPEATAGDYATVAELIAELRAVYGNLPLVPHNKWTNTACPGVWDLARLDREARGTKPAPSAGPAAAPVMASRVVTANPAIVRTGPGRQYPTAPGYPNGIARGATLAVAGYVAGEDPYGTGDDAWYVTKSGYYVWANGAGNSLAGLPRL